jgi:hypothetical protein
MSNGKKATGKKRTTRQDPFRLDLLVRAQQSVAVHVGEYLVATSGLLMKGAYTPSEWFNAYASMWNKIAHDLTSLANEF